MVKSKQSHTWLVIFLLLKLSNSFIRDVFGNYYVKFQLLQAISHLVIILMLFHRNLAGFMEKKVRYNIDYLYLSCWIHLLLNQ